MGYALNNVYKLKRINDQKFWNKTFWNTYAEKYGATHFLAKRYAYWLYRAAILYGWGLFAAASITVILGLVIAIKHIWF